MKQNNSWDKFILCFAFIFYLYSVNAQIVGNGIIPPHPPTASLGEYGNLPVGLFTGTPNINLEIYTLEDRGVKIPITISYSSSGLQVDAVPKQLGLDWNLLATGVITRVIRDLPDETNSIAPMTPSFLSGLKCTYAEEGIADGNSQTTLAICDPSNPYNTEYDIFNIHAFGLSGRFYKDRLNGYTMIESSKVKIEMQNNNTEFKITNTDGTEYYFGQNNAREEIDYTSQADMPTAYVSSWFLTKILYTNGQKVEFLYTTVEGDYLSSISQGYTVTRTGFPGYIFNKNWISQYGQDNCVKTYTTYTSKQLSEIKMNNKRLVFEYQNLDPSLPNNNDNYISSQLSKIIVYKDQTTSIKNFVFSYYTVPTTPDYEVTRANLSEKKIFLMGVEEYSASMGSSFVKYAFDYYDKEQLPPRLSFAKDFYGYFNGKHNSNSLINTLPYNSIDGFFANFPQRSNRHCDPSYISKGMLKKIIYPTKGRTEIVYEPNGGVITRWVDYPDNLAEVTATYGTSHQPTTFSTAAPQTAFLICSITPKDGASGYENVDCSGITEAKMMYQTITLDADIKIVNTNNNQVFASYNASKKLEYSSAHPNGKLLDYKLEISVENLPAGSYRVEIEKNGDPCTYVTAKLEYYTGVNVPGYQNVYTHLAGVRVQKMTDYDLMGGSKTKRFYYSSDISNLNTNSAKFPANHIYERYCTSDIYSPDVYTPSNTSESKTLHSEMKNLVGTDGYPICYSSVITSYGGDNFEQGAEVNNFKFTADIQNITMCPPTPSSYPQLPPSCPRDHNAPNSNVLGNGKLLSQIVYKKENNSFLKVEENTYQYDKITSLDYQAINLSGLYCGKKRGPYVYANSQGYIIQLTSRYGITGYYINSGFHYLKSKMEKHYNSDGTKSVDVETQYEYDPNHLQMTSEKITTLSNGGSIETKNSYAHSANLASRADVTELKTRNMVAIPLYIEKVDQSQQLLSKQETEYSTFNTTTAGTTLMLPKYIRSAKGAQSLETKMTYDYDLTGNIQQYSPSSGSPVVILWGYNKSLPIAKIENATASQVSAALSTTVSGLQSITESNLNSIDALRSSMPATMVSTYKYTPLRGIIEETNSRGLKTGFDYDVFDRLKSLYDYNGMKLKEYEYNYRY